MSNKLRSYKLKSCQGSAMVAVLVILAVAMLVITVVMQNVLVDVTMSFNLKKSNEAYNNAISALEEANLQLIRNPNFSGETLNLSDGNATIEVSGDNPKNVRIISRVRGNKYICQIEALATFNVSGILSVSNIKEKY